MIEPCGNIKGNKRAFPGPTWKCGSGSGRRVRSGLFRTLPKPPRARRPLFVKKKAISGSARDQGCQLFPLYAFLFCHRNSSGGCKKGTHNTRQSAPSALYYRDWNIKEKIQSLSFIYALNIVGTFPPRGLGLKLVGYSGMFVVDEPRTGHR